MSVPISPGTKFSQFNFGGQPVAGDLAAGLRNGRDTLFDIAGSGPPSTLTLTVNQIGHGFLAGNVLRLNGAVYVLAQANNAVNAEVVGIVSSVIDANDFILQFAGVIVNLPVPISPLTPGGVYFLSPTAAGAMTLVAPVTPGQILKSLLIANTTTSGFWLNNLGQQL